MNKSKPKKKRVITGWMGREEELKNCNKPSDIPTFVQDTTDEASEHFDGIHKVEITIKEL